MLPSEKTEARAEPAVSVNIAGRIAQESTAEPLSDPSQHSEQSRETNYSGPAGRSRWRGTLTGLDPRRISGIYGIAALVIVFSLLKPELFPTRVTLTLILSNQAVTGLLALGFLIPLAAGCVDLSVASVAGFSAVFAAWLNIHHWGDVAVVVVAIVASAGFGLLSGLVVTRLKLDSFVVTLGVSSVALGITELIGNGNDLSVQFGHTLTSLGQGGIGFFPWMAVVFLVVAVLLYIWFEHTTSGRYVLATGSSPVAARLTGIRVDRLQLLSLLSSAVFAGLAGILIDASVGSVSEVTASGYLLPAIAAVFLGTTQWKLRPNVIGTVVAVYLLGTGIKGLQILGAHTWVSDFFNGVVLLLAVILSVLRRRSLTASRSVPREPEPEKRRSASGGRAGSGGSPLLGASAGAAASAEPEL